jgi:hypothetical protein
MRKNQREVTRKPGVGSFVLLSHGVFPPALAIRRMPTLQRARSREGEAKML